MNNYVEEKAEELKSAIECYDAPANTFDYQSDYDYVHSFASVWDYIDAVYRDNGEKRFLVVFYRGAFNANEFLIPAKTREDAMAIASILFEDEANKADAIDAEEMPF